MTIMWTIWTHRIISFSGAKCNPVTIIELGRKIFHETSIYGNCIAPKLSHASKELILKDGFLLYEGG